MRIELLTSTQDLDLYNEWIKTHPEGTLWQSLERKQYLEALGKEVRIYALKTDAHIRTSALVVIDKTVGGYSVWDIPRGPIEVESGKRKVQSEKEEVERDVEVLMRRIVDDTKKERCVALYASPTVALQNSKFTIHNSKRHIHCEATRIIDLTQTEEDILAQMKQKGRYNIKVAQKHGVTVRQSDDIDVFYHLMTKTGARDGFTHPSKKQYVAFVRSLPGAFLLLAYDAEGEPIAGVLSVIWNNQAIYYYGASNHAQRAKMAPYLLQWESMRFCKERGCTSYDLLGIAPPDSPPSHPWAGISGFKEKFGGKVVMYPPEQMIVLRPFVYWFLRMKRRIFG